MNTFILYTEGTTKVDLSSVNNKIGVLDDVCIYANVYRCLDSNDMLTLKILCSEENNIYKQVSKKQIIMTYINGRYIPYVICSLEKDLDEINIVCRQWTIETTKSMFIKDAKPRDLNGLAMLDWLKMHCEEYGIRQYATDLEVGSNISTLGSSNLYYCDMYECVNKLSELYGAEINRDGFKIELVDFRGSKTPKYTIEYGENLLSNTQFEKYDYATGCYASGFDGIKSPIVYSGKLATNKNLLGQTIEIQTKVRVRTNSSSEEDGDYLYFNTEEEAIQELTKIAKEIMEKGGIDEPIVEFETKFIDLALTEEYKEIISKTFLEVGDTVRVKINKYNNLDINVRVYEWNFNPLTQEIGDITLSNNDIKSLTPPTISSISQEVKKLPSIDDVIETSRRESEAIVNQGFNGFTHYRPNYTAWTNTKEIKGSIGLCANYTGWFFYDKTDPETGEPIAEDSKMIADREGNFNCSVLNSGQINCGLLKVGIISSVDGSISINIENGEFRIGGRNGDVAKHTPTYSEWKNKDGSITRVDANGFYNQVGSTKREYHHLNFTKKITFPATSGSGGGYTSTIVALPTEFKGKTITATASISNAPGNYVPSSWGVVGTVSTMVDVMSDNTLKVYGQLLCWDTKNNTWHNLNERLEVTVTAIA